MTTRLSASATNVQSKAIVRCRVAWSRNFAVFSSAADAMLRPPARPRTVPKKPIAGIAQARYCTVAMPDTPENQAAYPQANTQKPGVGFPIARILVMGPASNREVADAREAKLELAIGHDEIPEGVSVHLKLDTGMGRWGLSELPAPSAEVVGIMSHLATADTDAAFAEQQIQRFAEATASHSHLTRHLANSAAALRLPAASAEDAVAS